MRVIVMMVRALLAVVRLWDVLIIIQVLGHLVTGGLSGVEDGLNISRSLARRS